MSPNLIEKLTEEWVPSSVPQSGVLMKKIKKRLLFMHRVTYINWALESKTQTVSIDIGKEKYQWLKANGIEAISMTKREDWIKENTYKMVRKGYWRSLTFFSNDTYNHWVWHSGDDSKNKGSFTNEGAHAAKAVNEHFQDRTGYTLKKAFGYTDSDILRTCVPKQFYYIQDMLKNVVLENVSKADMSSHYPASMCGRLPDLHTAIKLEGEHSPTEEYPFAFMIGSGHCAEYNRFDTREWKNHPIAQTLVNDTKEIAKKKILVPRYTGKCEYTILCKASKYELTDEMTSFYDKKKEGDSTAKMVMNSFIGYCHPKTDRLSYRLYHLAAICIGRANQKMIETAEKLGEENICQIVVDGISYIDNGADTDIVSNQKKLGAFIKENDKESFKMIGINQYMFMKDETITDLKASSFTAGIKETKTFDDMSEWRRV